MKVLLLRALKTSLDLAGIFNTYNLENAISTIVRVQEQSKNQIETGDQGKKRV